jgi:hypothetical protein
MVSKDTCLRATGVKEQGVLWAESSSHMCQEEAGTCMAAQG